MEINWFTFFAQIINFLILLAILQKVLYRPIIEMMEQREKGISDRLLAAEQKWQEAEEQGAYYRQKQEEWDSQQAQRLAQGKAEVEEIRQTLIEQTRLEVQENEMRWQASLERQKELFFKELRGRVIQQIQKTIHQILTQLADVTLEERLIKVFLQRINNLKGNELELFHQMVTSINHDQSIVVYSAFEIPEASRQVISQSLQAKVSQPIKTKFEIVPDLICGIELRATGCKLAWSIDSYLNTLEENLVAAFEGTKDK
ncbi:MAG TPA: F0F1 ATP synthase subunit B [Cyanothece sp. UBA12306]|nr:F0F1 ATP synthase subunit B [Cyanothece sp. UBA12306]